MSVIEFWFSVGHLETYFTVLRLKCVERDLGVVFEWRPFSSGILAPTFVSPDTGSDNRQARAHSVYEIHSLQRRAHQAERVLSMPIETQLESRDIANRVATLARREGWCADYTHETYRLWLEHGLPPGTEDSLRQGLGNLGQAFDRVMKEQAGAVIAADLVSATETARERGVFGSPSFVTPDREVFWGDAHLETAVEWARTHVPSDKKSDRLAASLRPLSRR